MSTFQTLIHEVCQVFGDHTFHCHTIYRTGGMMALIVFYVVQFKAVWLAMATLTVQTQSDFWNMFGLLKSEKSALTNGLINTLKWLSFSCPLKLIALYVILASCLCKGKNLYVSQLPSLIMHSFSVFLARNKLSSVEDLRNRPLLRSLLWTKAGAELLCLDPEAIL